MSKDCLSYLLLSLIFLTGSFCDATSPLCLLRRLIPQSWPNSASGSRVRLQSNRPSIFTCIMVRPCVDTIKSYEYHCIRTKLVLSKHVVVRIGSFEIVSQSDVADDHEDLHRIALAWNLTCRPFNRCSGPCFLFPTLSASTKRHQLWQDYLYIVAD
jgi:hypothetical protein